VSKIAESSFGGGHTRREGSAPSGSCDYKSHILDTGVIWMVANTALLLHALSEQIVGE
jgi:hypothetical protein